MNRPVSQLTVGAIRIGPMTEAALDAVVEIHLAAFPDYMNASLGRGYLRAFLRGFLQRTDALALMAVSESGQVLGYAAGAPVQSVPEMTRALASAAALALLVRPWLFTSPRIRRTVWRTAEQWLGRSSRPKATPLLPMPTFSLVSIGVDPQARGRGVGDQLLKAFEQEVRQRGGIALRLSVYPSNHGARQFYERHGWQPFDGDVPPGEAMYYSKVF
jgi:ribosomal protein S18 acetylase RimI-like enzyme